MHGELSDGKLNTEPDFREEHSGDLDSRRARFALENFDLIFIEFIDFDDFGFVSECAPLFDVPDDVAPDWEEAVYEGMRALMIAIEHRKAPDIRERNLVHDFPEIQGRMRTLYRRFFASELTDPLFEPDELT